MMEETICDFNIYFGIRFIFSYYHNFNACKLVCWIARLFCFFRGVCFIIVLSFKTINLTSFTLLTLLTIEHFFYILISLKYGNGYLQQYSSKMLLIDDISNAKTYKLIEKCLIIITLIFFLSKFSYSYVLFNNLENFHLNTTVLLCLLLWMALDIGRMPLLLVFAILYSRVRYVRKTMERNPFDCRSLGKHHPQTYIQMYEIIMDSLDRIKTPMKLQMFVYCFVSVPYTLFGIKITLEQLKKDELIVLSFIIFVLDVLVGYMPLFLSAVLSDLVHEELEEIMAIVVERRNYAKNERDRAEIHKLFEFLKSNPFEYSLWRLVPLNVRSLLFFVSYCITTIIAVLQINDMGQ